MLYPNNALPSLSEEAFKNPGSEYRGAPFWAWNCSLEKDELLWQLDMLKKMGFGGAHMHVRTGMATRYLSSEHMALIKACVRKCKDEKLLAWLYDEDRWPSGAAGGIVTSDPRFRARHLLFTVKPYSNEDSEGENTEMSASALRSGDGTLLAVYDIALDEDGCLCDYKRIAENEQAKGSRWYVYAECDLPSPWYNNQTYVNTLDKSAIDRFIEVTYETYLNAVGADFGGSVPAIFTDEPQFVRKGTLGFAKEEKDVILPWADDVPKTYREAYGEELIDKLPELIWELPDQQVSLTRYRYHDHIAERFARAFADNCSAWCEKHHLMLTGHMMEEPTLESQTAALGDAMRSYRSFQLPGIDMLCARFELTTAKQAQSAARQYGRLGVLSELYGVTGWAFDFRGHKLHGDWQAALGVTVRVPHLTWVSMKGAAKRDYPASIGYQSPWWKEYSYVEDHFARVNAALTRGKPLARVGVIHPVESYWLHWGPAEQTRGVRGQMDENFQNLTDWLLTGTIDFDFICESLLPSQCALPCSSPLRVGEMAYDAVIVPGCETLRSTTLSRLEAFSRAGGLLIFLGSAPAYENAVLSDRGRKLYESAACADFSREGVLNALEGMRDVEIRGANGARADNLIYQLREDGDALWLFVAHCREPYNKDIPKAQELRLTVRGEYEAEIYDTQSGSILPADYSHENGSTVLRATLYDYDSLLVRLGHEKREVFSAVLETKDGSARELPIPERVAFTLDEPNALLLDKAEVSLDGGAFSDKIELLRADNDLRARLGWPLQAKAVAQPWAIPAEVIEHRVTLRFVIDSAIPVSHARLALEDADKAEISLNGASVPIQIDGWYVDKAIQTFSLPPLRAGENVLTVTLPFGKRTNVEWCYLLGDFGVELSGAHRRLVPSPAALGFDDATRQLLPHYGGNIDYQLPLETRGGHLCVILPHYDGAAVKVLLDGQDAGMIAYPPYVLYLGAPRAGAHTLTLRLLGHRENAFGPLHRADTREPWTGPDAWYTSGARWTESYRLTRLGIRSAPRVIEYDIEER